MLDNSKYITEGLSLMGEKYMMESGSIRFISINNLKEVLLKNKLSYNEFMEEYFSLLKSIKYFLWKLKII
ncbi:MAG: hypothetical protein E6Q24_05635 [Chitinophagaceae bacterium]|nr:MAG: hypothetical protein E6Q24_05635 [Chitinophagaceae bacterium]